MRKAIRSLEQMEALLGPDPLSEALRGKIREMIFGEFRGHNTNFFDPDGGNANMPIILRRSLS